MTVVRLLQLGWETGIVRIEVRSPTRETELAEQLTAAPGLRAAVVVPALGCGAELHALVDPALEELAGLDLQPADVLTVSWDQTRWELAQAPRFPDLTGVRIADASGVQADVRPVPALSSPRLRRSLLPDESIAARVELWAARRGDLGRREAYRDRPEAAVGDVSSRHFDIHGNPVALPEENRPRAVSRERLQAARTGIAAKVQSIVAAAKAKLIDVLVTSATAREANA
jgi:DNA-binding transcriptional regulator LsrR (DeoR family)